MATAKAHYDHVLSDIYSWMFGGFDSGIEKNSNFFRKHQIYPARSGLAIDLGAGCGFQSIPLAKAGFSVIAIDVGGKLLDELKHNCGDLKIRIVQDDLVNFDKYTTNKVELIVCMTDSLIHLQSKDRVTTLFNKVIALLERKGKFVITFRDLSMELADLDRFIPVKSDPNTILTCFLEYELETVKVHDIIYKKDHHKWQLIKGFYRKLRISQQWVTNQLTSMGFTLAESTVEDGFVTIIATK